MQAVDDAKGREDLQIEWLTKDSSCQSRAKPGSVVSIMHKGWVDEVPEGQDAAMWNGKQIDQNIDSEPLKFTLRKRQILRGMDFAIEGMCVGEKISVVIPPHLAYDDPIMNFNWGASGKQRPAPPGSSVRYEVELIGLEGGAAVGGDPYLMAALAFMVLVIAGLVFALRRTESKSGKSGGAKEKEKKKRK